MDVSDLDLKFGATCFSSISQEGTFGIGLGGDGVSWLPLAAPLVPWGEGCAIGNFSTTTTSKKQQEQQ
jgi:hypothetical protein